MKMNPIHPAVLAALLFVVLFVSPPPMAASELYRPGDIIMFDGQRYATFRNFESLLDFGMFDSRYADELRVAHANGFIKLVPDREWYSDRKREWNRRILRQNRHVSFSPPFVWWFDVKGFSEWKEGRKR